MPNAPIAGPRRLRPTALPRQPSVEVTATQAESAPTTSYSRPVAAATGPGSDRSLPALDYDDTGRGKRPAALETTRPGRRRRSNRVLWFVLGIAFGAVAAVLVQGDAMATLRAARAWGASTLRSLEQKPSPAANAPSTASAAALENTPCPVDPGPGDPCAELLAPFATTSIPTVNVDDLPTVVPVATVVVVARRHARGPARAAAHAPPAPVADESPQTEPTPAGINPDEDGPQARPARAVPTAAPPVERPVTEPPVEQKSAKNDAT